MLKVVCWKWKPLAGYRSKFEAHHVNTLRNMVARNYASPHEFVCITDDPEGIDPNIRIIPLWDDLSDVPSPHGGVSPSCYRRLKAFSQEMAYIIGPRFVSVDLDVVITGDITPLWNRKEDFIIWGDQLRTTPYNGSMWLMNAGAREEVWSKFDSETSPKRASLAGFLGSDQAWMSYILGPRERKWTTRDGVYAFRTDIRRHRGQLPKDARIVFFQGHLDPWMPQAKKLSPWIDEYYR